MIKNEGGKAPGVGTAAYAAGGAEVAMALMAATGGILADTIISTSIEILDANSNCGK